MCGFFVYFRSFVTSPFFPFVVLRPKVCFLCCPIPVLVASFNSLLAAFFFFFCRTCLIAPSTVPRREPSLRCCSLTLLYTAMLSMVGVWVKGRHIPAGFWFSPHTCAILVVFPSTTRWDRLWRQWCSMVLWCAPLVINVVTPGNRNTIPPPSSSFILLHPPPP